MAEIHATTLVPNKVELLTGWLPRQPWYAAVDGGPHLTKAGGFRLDDPTGEVGLEFLFVRDDAHPDALVYHVPMSYRGAPVPELEPALIGTTEHGVLGTRWIYDGVHDAVLVAQAAALIQGTAEPQHQSVSYTPDPSVTVVAGRGEDPTPEVHFVRVLSVVEGGTMGSVTAGWTSADGSTTRGPVLTAE